MPRAPRSSLGKPYDRPRSSVSDEKWVHDKAPVGVPRAVVNAGLGPQGPPSNRLVVSNLHYEVTAKDLISIFGQIGTLVREPDIKYDRSGRSTGIAYITFETPAEATRAKNQFNRVPAKGQPMEIAYDTRPAKRTGGADTKSLLNRISKPPLIKRMASEGRGAVSKDVKADIPKVSTNGGPVRTARDGKRGGARLRGERVRKEPKTAEDLDKELDAFMGDDNSSKPTTSEPAATGEDVEMA